MFTVPADGRSQASCLRMWMNMIKTLRGTQKQLFMLCA